MVFLGRVPLLVAPPKYIFSRGSIAGGLRSRKILSGELARQTRTERGSIGERPHSDYNIHAVGFGGIKQ